jgi:hypothetical protein
VTVEAILQFFILNAMTVSIADIFKARLDRLVKEDQESQAKTKATLRRIKELIVDLKKIDLED